MSNNTITAEQIAAGAAVLNDDGKPVGRNTAVMVWDAMSGASTSGEAPADGWPSEIYLNTGEGPLRNFSEYDEVDWCDHPQGENDVRYVRAEPAGIERAASGATASGDELTDVETLLYDHARAVEHVHEYGDTGGFYNARVDAENAIRAAVSAATKPTADLPTNDEVFAEVSRQRDLISNARFVSPEAVRDTIAAVRSLLATKPAAPAMPECCEVMRKALTTIALWELPATGKTWPSGGAISYEAEYGSNGARDYMRQVAFKALEAAPMASADAVIEAREQALEEAAKAMNQVPMWSNCSILISAAQATIRALKRNKAAGAEGAE